MNPDKMARPKSVSALIAENIKLRNRVDTFRILEFEAQRLARENDELRSWQTTCRIVDASLAEITDRVVAEARARLETDEELKRKGNKA